MNGIHDVGGMDGFGPINIEENEPVFHHPWEGRMRAIHTIVGKKRHIYNSHESRHGVERLNPIFYLGATYYEKWLLRMERLLIEKGVLTEEEIDERMKRISPEPLQSHLQPYRHLAPTVPSTERRFTIQGTEGTKPDPKFSPGMSVKVKVMSLLGHTRVPRYVRGRHGVIEKIHGNFIVPDIKVHEGKDVYQPVYLVRFEAQELWGEDASPKDKLYIEMWEDYLELGGNKNEKD